MSRDIKDIVEDLREFAVHENTGVGDACCDLISCYESREFFGDSFNKAVRKEIKDYLAYFKMHTKLVERKENVERIITEVVWNWDQE